MDLIEGTTNILLMLYAQARTHHNSRALIHRLPDDILLKIFYYNSPSEAFDDNGSGYLQVPRTQLAFTLRLSGPRRYSGGVSRRPRRCWPVRRKSL
jgi:hypothetical protein